MKKDVPVATLPGPRTGQKERGILFSAPMVRAVMREENPKTQTRRIVMPQPPEESPVFVGYTMDSTCRDDVGKFVWAESNSPLLHQPHRVRCPYGQPGDRLWVRETWQALHVSTDFETGQPDDWWHAKEIPKDSDDGFWGIAYAATEPAEHRDDRGYPWRPAIHMPRWASRLTLEVTGIRVERLQDITEADAVAEGATFTDFGKDRWGNQHPGWTMEPPATDQVHCLGSARYAFANLINKINGPECWDANPWVWVVEFRKAAQAAPERSSAEGSPHD